MARRRGSSLRNWGVLFGVLLTLALVGVVVQLVRQFWWAFLLAGVAVAIAFVVSRSRRVRVAALPQTTMSAPMASHPVTRPGAVPTLRGEGVRSRGEARIADFLHRHGYAYQYEPTICGFRPDFYVPELNLIIEHWGMEGEEYERRRRVKTAAYRANGFAVIHMQRGDWDRLETELQRKMYRFDQTVYKRA